MKEKKENIKVTSTVFLEIAEWYNLLVVYMVKGGRLGSPSQILWVLDFGANLVNVAIIRNSGFLKSSVELVFYVPIK